ncbi:MAG: ribonuclease H family protein [Peptoniphilus sp.]|nr:ribonuclease H family protein [Peptoniphilus sp.]
MYYAVKKGREIGIFTTWDEAKKQVVGYSGAVYKKFAEKSSAEDFMKDEIASFDEKLEEKTLNEDEIIAYVDGSYNIKDKSFSYGVLLFDNSGIYEEHSKRFYGEDSSMRNVAGEIRGAAFAMKRSLELGKKKVYLHYDYSGIENWAKRTWKANKSGTMEYRDYYAQIENRLEVVFVKVKAHSGVKYNEVVDKLAKDAK